jgi:hypothetical protein
LCTGTTTACFHRAGKICCDKLKLKICFKTGTKMSVHPLIINPGMSSTPTDLDGLRRLMALETSEIIIIIIIIIIVIITIIVITVIIIIIITTALI